MVIQKENTPKQTKGQEMKKVIAFAIIIPILAVTTIFVVVMMGMFKLAAAVDPGKPEEDEVYGI